MKQLTNVDQRLQDRTLKIIEQRGYIFLKKGEWYLSCWTNIAGGPDHASWARREGAQEIFDLKWAFALAHLYDCKVVSYYPQRVMKRLVNQRNHPTT